MQAEIKNIISSRVQFTMSWSWNYHNLSGISQIKSDQKIWSHLDVGIIESFVALFYIQVLIHNKHGKFYF